MGQSILSDRRTPFRNGAIRRKRVVMCPYLTKGNRVNIPEPEHGDWIASGRFQCGNANETGDVGAGPGKSSLFFVRDGHPGIGLAGDRVVVPVKHRASRGVRCTCVGP